MIKDEKINVLEYEVVSVTMRGKSLYKYMCCSNLSF